MYEKQKNEEAVALCDQRQNSIIRKVNPGDYYFEESNRINYVEKLTIDQSQVNMDIS